MLRLIIRLLNPIVHLIDWLSPFKTPPQDIQLPVTEHVPAPASTQEDIDTGLDALIKGAEAWSLLSNGQKADILRACLMLLKKHHQAAAENAVSKKGSYESGAGEDLAVLLPSAVALDEYERLLRKGPTKPRSKRKVGDQWVCDVFPRGLDNMLLGGAVGEIWIKPGHEPTQGEFDALLAPNFEELQLLKRYLDAQQMFLQHPTIMSNFFNIQRQYGTDMQKRHSTAPGVACILAAGNQISVAMRDLLQQLVVNNKACIVKLNPVNDWIGADLQNMLQPLIDVGMLRLVYGGTSTAQALVNDARVGALHMTGSTATYNAIVWGSPSGPGAGPQLCTKPFEAELGCVTPHIVVPSARKWPQAELEYHARVAVAACVLNSGHNCLSTELIVTARGWPQREAFLEALRKVLDSLSQRWPWYPNSMEKMAAFKRQFPHAEERGVGVCTMARCTQPFLLAPNVRASDAATQHENWSPVLQEVPLDCPLLPDGSVNVSEFFNAAADFCNGQVFGTLSCSMSIHPSTQRKHRRTFEKFLADLKYGNIVVNAATSLGFCFCPLPWGAWAAAGTPEDIGSGNVLPHSGVYDHVEKGVLRCPWILTPYPFYFMDNTSLESTSTRMLAYIANRSLLTLVPLLASALTSKHGKYV